MDARTYAAFAKHAEEAAPSIAKTMLQGVAGTALGYGAGYGTGRALQALSRRAGIPPTTIATKILPIAGALGGAAYPLWKAYEQKELTRAVEHRRSSK